MFSNKFKRELREKSELYASWIFSMLLDTAFIAFWLFLTWAVNKLTEIFLINTVIEQIWLEIYLFIFEISTMIATLLYVIQDLVKIWRQFRHQILNSGKSK